MRVNLGGKGIRTIFAGIKKWFSPNDLIGKQGIFVANLKPRKMLDSVSEGMMLCAQDQDGKPYPVIPSASVPNGTRLK
jgi:methionyl-tRNA synthetase